MTSTAPARTSPGRDHVDSGVAARVLATAVWAFSMATADKRNRTRLAVMAVGIGLCAFALLAVATVDPLVSSMMARADASQPSVTAAGPEFRYQDVSNVVDGEVVKGTLLAGPPDAAPPHGAEVFPGPGELVVSPALATAIADPDAQSLRALLPGSVVGVIASTTLTSAQEWRYYQGVENLPADAFTATGWGIDTGAIAGYTGPSSVASMNPQVWVILITGVTVLLIPLLLFTAMAGRIGATHRDRRSATLRLMGASSAQLRWIVAAEVALASALGLSVAAAAYLTVRALAPFITIGEDGAQSGDLRPDPGLTVLIAVGVPVVAGLSALAGSRRASVTPLGDQTRATRRPTLWWRLALLVVTIGISAYVVDRSAQWGGDGFGYGTFGLCVLVVLDIACVVAAVSPLTYGVASSTRGGGPGVQLARGRIVRHPGSSSCPAAAVASVLASIIALMSVLQLQPGDPFAAGDAPRPYYGRVVDLSPGEWQRLYQDLRSVNGVSAVEMSATLPISSSTASAQLFTCDAIRWITDTGTVCRDGDVFGQMETAASPGQDRFSVTGSASVWSPPSGTRVTRGSAPDGQPAQNSYLLTPAVVQTQIPDLATIPDTRVGVWVSPSALGAARDAVAWLGWRSATVLTYSDYASDFESFSWVRVALLVCAAFVLLLSALAQWLSAAEYVGDRRRSFALARASGVPTSTLTRSVVIGALLPVLVGVVVAAGVGLLLAWEIADTRGWNDVSVDLTWLGIGGAVTLSVSFVVALGTAAQLRRTTGPAALRTE